MVRLKRLTEMSVLKDVTIRPEESRETEVWIALMKTAISFNSLNPVYDGFYYKSEIVINNMDRTQLRLRLRGGRQVILKFGSPNTKEEFYRMAEYSQGIEAPCPSRSSTTPSPPKTTPSPPTTPFPPSTTPSPPSTTPSEKCV